MAYRAEIEIGVNGLRELRNLRKTVDEVNQQVDLLNDVSKQFNLPLQNIQAYNRTLAIASDTLTKVRAGTQQETDAITDYVNALGEANAARDRQNRLIDLQIQKQKELKNVTPRVALRAQERSIFVQETISRGRSARIARERSAFLQGTSGPQQLGPVAGAGALGFPVALPQTSAEKQLSKRLEITRRIKQTQEELAGSTKKLAAVTARGVTDEKRKNGVIRQRLGLRGALQDLETKAKVSISDANRQQEQLNAKKEAQLQLEEEIAVAIKKAENLVKRNIAAQKKLERVKAAEAKKRRARFSEDLLLGAGFPLLFGGGPGAVLGGVGGAIAGGGRGGFGLQIFGSAIGQQLDAIAQDALNTATALTSTAGALDFVREKSLFSSDAVKEQAAVLEEQGDVAGLAALLTGQLAEKIGNQGVQSLVDLGKTTNETTQLWNELTLQLQALISGPLNTFLKIVNSVLKGATTGLRREAFFESLGENEAAARAEFKKLTGESLGEGRSGAAKRLEAEAAGAVFLSQEDALNQLVKKYAVPIGPIIPQTLQDRRDIKPPKDTAGDKAKREQQRIEERIKKLQLERETIAKITEFKNRIAMAEENLDKVKVRQIQGEQRIFEIQQEQKQSLIGEVTEREKAEIKLLSQAKILAETLATERDVAAIERQRNAQFENTLSNLQFELGIATAVTREEAEQLRIRQEMENLSGRNFSDEQLQRIEQLKQDLNRTKQPLENFILESTRSLTDLEQVAVNVSQGIGNAIGNSLSKGISQLVEGSATVKEVFADLLKSVGQVLVQEGTKMIATYIAIGIAKAFAGLGTAVGEQASLPGVELGSGGGSFTNIAGNEFSTLGPNFGFRTRANGGTAKAGQPYMVGERGPELFVPSANGGVMRNEDMRQLMGRSPVGAAPQMNFTFETTNIGGQEFVSREQLEAAMATTRRQAANEGAKRGMSMTLDKMQNSPRTRSRIGIS